MKILIIGCGYLGKECVKLLKNKATLLLTAQKNPIMIQGASFSFLKPSSFGKIPKLVSDHDVIIVTASASGGDYLTSYLVLARHLKKALSIYKNKTLIYTSSTGVYEESSGCQVNENSPLAYERAKILIETEKTYLSIANHRIVILRLSGLFGTTRSLTRMYERYKQIEIVEKIVNFIHVRQAAYAVSFAVKTKIRGIYNCSSMSLKNTDIIRDLFSIEPKIIKQNYDSPHGGSKIVVSNKIKSLPGFKMPSASLLS